MIKALLLSIILAGCSIFTIKPSAENRAKLEYDSLNVCLDNAQRVRAASQIGKWIWIDSLNKYIFLDTTHAVAH